MKSLQGKTALVTGASSGIGKATALALVEAGAKVVVSARRVDRLKALQESLGSWGQEQILPVNADAANSVETDALLEKAIAFGSGRLDIVVANAGHGLAGGVLSSDRTRWEEMFQLNVIGAAHLMRQAGNLMVKQQGGDIVAIGSVVGVNISPFSGFYGATKFALVSLAEALRREICQHKVRVSVIKPAIVESEFQAVAGYDAENFGKAMRRFGKLLAPEDVARAIVFVLSQPPHVHINDLMIRPLGQDYP